MVDYSPRSHKESDTIERLTLSLTRGLLIVPIIQTLKLSQLMFIASVSSHWNSLVWRCHVTWNPKLPKCRQDSPCAHQQCAHEDFPGGPVVNTSPSNARGAGSVLGQEAKTPHALGPKNQTIKQKQVQYRLKKSGPHQTVFKRNQCIHSTGLCTAQVYTLLSSLLENFPFVISSQ